MEKIKSCVYASGSAFAITRNLLFPPILPPQRNQNAGPRAYFLARRYTLLRAVNDMVFKFIFGEESRKELLRELVNIILERVGLPLAATVTIRNPFSLRKFASDKE
ncbi:MAG: hypothetical protein WCQ50_22125, partial [Spirochaetota bacterium]